MNANCNLSRTKVYIMFNVRLSSYMELIHKRKVVCVMLNKLLKDLSCFLFSQESQDQI